MNDYVNLRVVDVRQETTDTRSLILEPENGEALHYKAGQFLTLIFDEHGREERRSYSLSSAPALNEPMTLTVKRVPNGAYSRYLVDRVTPGTLLRSIGVAGFFTLPSTFENTKGFFFFAAGGGIAPVLPLIKTILVTSTLPRVVLVYSNSSPKTTIFLNEIQALLNTYGSRFSVELLFSNAQNLLRARLSKFLVAELVNVTYADLPKSETLYYLCGPYPYMQMITIVLLTEGVPDVNIRKEIFNPDKPPVRELPPDQDPHEVTVYFKGTRNSYVSQYPETILSTALQNGIRLPYSCEAGKCGTCAATCESGKVWMSYNEVLTASDIRDRRVLTCTGYPVGGDIVLRFD